MVDVTALGFNDDSDQNHLTTLKRYQMILDQCLIEPQMASTWLDLETFDGDNATSLLPVHLACAMQPSDLVLEAIMNAYPYGVHKKELASGRLPLHIACKSGARDSTIKLLLERHPEAAQIKDSRGRLALHYACWNRASIVTIDALLEACPGAVRAEDRGGFLPLHAACSAGAPELVVRRLVGSFPESVALRTKKGKTPVACARTNNCPNKDQVVAFLDDSAERVERLSMFSANKAGEKRQVLKRQNGSPRAFRVRSKKIKAKACPGFV